MYFKLTELNLQYLCVTIHQNIHQIRKVHQTREVSEMKFHKYYKTQWYRKIPNVAHISTITILENVILCVCVCVCVCVCEKQPG